MKVKIFGSLAVFTVVLATPLVAGATVNPSVTLSYDSLGAFSDHSAAIAKTVADQDASSLLTEHLPYGKQAYGKFFKLADGSSFTASASYAKPKNEIAAGKPGRSHLGNGWNAYNQPFGYADFPSHKFYGWKTTVVTALSSTTVGFNNHLRW